MVEKVGTKKSAMAPSKATKPSRQKRGANDTSKPALNKPAAVRGPDDLQETDDAGRPIPHDRPRETKAMRDSRKKALRVRGS